MRFGHVLAVCVVVCIELTRVSARGARQALRPLGVRVLGVPSDGEGPRPDALRALLTSARLRGLRRCAARCAHVSPRARPAPRPGRAAAGAPRVKLFYAVPVSCNPTGVSWSLERKRAVYALACEFDFLLLEDDAYFYLQFPPREGPACGEAPGLFRLGASLLSLDTQSRVVRVDTFSKCLAPGLRLGWLSAPPGPLAERLGRAMQASAQGANSHAQVLAARLLSEWGPAGLDAHLRALQADYARCASALSAAAARHLGGGLASFAPPSAGMFLWLRLGCGVSDSEALQPLLQGALVAVVPGAVFHVDRAPCPFVRLSFASASDAQFDAAMARLAALLRALPGAPRPEA